MVALTVNQGPADGWVLELLLIQMRWGNMMMYILLIVSKGAQRIILPSLLAHRRQSEGGRDASSTPFFQHFQVMLYGYMR
jgi:hypothetical protein